MKKKSIYLIPYDFTEVSESALELGFELAKFNKGSVMLLHVLKKDKDKRKVKNDFEDVVKKFNEEDRELIDYRVIVGDLFEDINKAAELLDVELVVMGTHGAKGFQKVFGSNAIKMISNSSKPFLVTQGKKALEKIKTIVMPLSFDKRSIQIANAVGNVAKEFNATIHLVGYHDKDEWLDNSTMTNLRVVKKYFNDNNVDFVISNIEVGLDFDKELMKYAEEVNADLMSATYFQGSIINNPKSFIQMMIENKLNLPLLTINAEELTLIKSSAMFNV